MVGDLAANSGMTLTTGIAGTSIYGFTDGGSAFRAGTRYNHNLDELQFISSGAQRMACNDVDAVANATELSLGSAATGSAGMTILCTGTGTIAWADAANLFRGGVRYAHGTDQLQWVAAGGQQMFLSSVGLFVSDQLSVDDDVTFESDLILDGATGAGDIDMAGSLTLDSASPAAIFGGTVGAPLLIVFKAAAATSNMFWRTSAGGAVANDKAFAHTPTESMEFRSHDGASFISIFEYTTTTIASNVAHTMETTLDVVGDGTFESDLTLDGATGAGDLTIAGDFLMDSASPTATIGDDLGAPTLEMRKVGTQAAPIQFFSDNVLRAALILNSAESFLIRVGATGTEFEASFNESSGRWVMPANLRVSGVDLDILNANARFSLGTDSATAVTIRRNDAASATPGQLLIEGGAHIGGGAGDFSGGNLFLAGGDTDDTGAAAAGGTITLHVGATLGGGGPGTIEAEGDTNITGDASVSGALEIDGFLNHDGANIGFYGVAPAVRPAAYTRSAVVVETRTLLANASATAANNNAVLAQILEDLASTGILEVA